MPITETGAGVPPRVVLYVRDGCHLCASALDVVREVCAETGATWATVDVDSGLDSDTDVAGAGDGDATGAGGQSLAERYGDLVPVVHVDGVRRGYWRLDRDRLRAALALAAPNA